MAAGDAAACLTDSDGEDDRDVVRSIGEARNSNITLV